MLAFWLNKEGVARTGIYDISNKGSGAWKNMKANVVGKGHCRG